MKIETAGLSTELRFVEKQCPQRLKPSPTATQCGTAKEAAEKLMLCIRAPLHSLRKNSCFVSGHDFSRAVPTPPTRALAPEGSAHLDSRYRGMNRAARYPRSLIALFFLSIAAHATAQQIGQNASATPSGTYTLTAKAQLVVETVVVKDKQGKFIPGLSAKDFTVTEDGAAQTIRFCEHQDLAAEEAPVAPAAPGTTLI
jgi:hypothetical protein